YGVEEALRLREGAAAGAELIGLALGPKRYEDAIRRALAMGLDRAIHIETDEVIDVIAQAKVLAAAIQAEGADLVFVGGKEADWDSAALGPALAEALGLPHADWVTKLSLLQGGGKIEVVHDIDDGVETLALTLPAVVTTQQGLNDPRYPTLPNIMKAKRKELKKTTPAGYGHAGVLSQIVGEEIQLKARRNVVIEDEPPKATARLIEHLRDEAKVL
ncbi:MAG: electron transfer flavoprotein subunit beta/FixA family protein, partial [Verrucomicrobia bacterium]|nr:electron transfer flavoprotein subunit beta/FixA family protein [Verrucomicrobiota bacterium]